MEDCGFGSTNYKYILAMVGNVTNRILIGRFYNSLWNDWRFELIPEFIASDMTFRGSLGIKVSGHHGFQQYMQTVRSAFPDFHNTIDEMIVEGDRIAARLTYRGTHQGPLFGVPATARVVEYSGAAIFQIRDELIVSGWVLGDTASLMASNWRDSSKLARLR